MPFWLGDNNLGVLWPGVKGTAGKRLEYQALESSFKFSLSHMTKSSMWIWDLKVRREFSLFLRQRVSQEGIGLAVQLHLVLDSVLCLQIPEARGAGCLF